MIIEIPGYKTLDLDYLVLDYNGTIAVDGLIPPAIKERLLLLGDSFKIYVLTADTHGTAAAMCDGLSLEIMTFPSGSAMDEKLRILSSLGAEHCIAIGNGRNDVPMCQAAALSIAVMGTEGAYGKVAFRMRCLHNFHSRCTGSSDAAEETGRNLKRINTTS